MDVFLSLEGGFLGSSSVSAPPAFFEAPNNMSFFVSSVEYPFLLYGAAIGRSREIYCFHE